MNRRRSKIVRKCEHIRGWDWSELSLVFDTGLVTDEHLLLSLIRMRLRDLRMDVDRANWDSKFKPSKEQRKQVAMIRRFLRKAASVSHHYDAPAFLGISRIADDGTMLAWVDHFLEWLWT